MLGSLFGVFIKAVARSSASRLLSILLAQAPPHRLNTHYHTADPAMNPRQRQLALLAAVAALAALGILLRPAPTAADDADLSDDVHRALRAALSQRRREVNARARIRNRAMLEGVHVTHNYEAARYPTVEPYYRHGPGRHLLSDERRAELEARDAVAAVLPAAWRPSPACPVPRTLLVLYGRLRTFPRTHRHLAALARQASGDCYLVVAVTEEEICEADPAVWGKCRGWRGGAAWWKDGASPLCDGVEDVRDAAKVLEAARPAFDNNVFATVYRSQDLGLSYLEKVHHLWGVRTRAAVENVVESFASHGMPLDLEQTVVVRTRFDVLPTTYPVFPWNDLPGLFQDPRGNPIVYAADFQDCQPDLSAYASLRGMREHVRQPFFDYTPCKRRPGEAQSGPIVMDDAWNLCRRDILRHNAEVEVPEEGLVPIPLGRHRRLYCSCRPFAAPHSSLDGGAADDGFQCHSRFGADFLYAPHPASLECPVDPLGAGSSEGCQAEPAAGPLGACLTTGCEVGHTHNVWRPEFADDIDEVVPPLDGPDTATPERHYRLSQHRREVNALARIRNRAMLEVE